MANAWYRGVDGVARKVTKPYRGDNGVARSVLKGYRGVNGVARQFFEKGTPIGEFPIGGSVYLKVDGIRTEFLIVHKGNPNNTLYDASCDGIWLLAKGTYGEQRAFGANNNTYASSYIHDYLTNTFVGLLDQNTLNNRIKTVKIPYVNGAGSTGTLATGANGLSTKVFLLSGYEVNGYGAETESYKQYFPKDGVCLSYFEGVGRMDRQRAAQSVDGTYQGYWLRSPSTQNNTCPWEVISEGQCWYRTMAASSQGVRPALIVNYSTLVDDDGNIL